jgi:hypothetical protein
MDAWTTSARYASVDLPSYKRLTLRQREYHHLALNRMIEQENTPLATPGGPTR